MIYQDHPCADSSDFYQEDQDRYESFLGGKRREGTLRSRDRYIRQRYSHARSKPKHGLSLVDREES